MHAEHEVDLARLRNILGTPEGKLALRLSLYRRYYLRFASEELKIAKKPDKKKGADQSISQIVPLYPFLPTQSILHEAYEAQMREDGFVRQCTLKQRQGGSSSYYLSRGFHLASLNRYVNTFTVANDITTAEVQHRTVKLYYDSMSEELKPTKRYSTRKELSFDDEHDPASGLHSSMLVHTAKNMGLGVSRTLAFLHFTEVAKYGKYTYGVPSILNAVPPNPGTVVIMESTADVSGDYFKDQCHRAERREGGWRLNFVPWWKSEEYSLPLRKGDIFNPDAEERLLLANYAEDGLTIPKLNWRRFKIAELRGDVAMFSQDFPSDWVSCWIILGYSVWPTSTLRKLEAHIKEPIRKCDIIPPKHIIDVPDGPLWIWEEPQPGQEYDIGADVSLEADPKPEHDEAKNIDDETVKEDEPTDYSAFQVLKRGTLEQVAEWKGQVDPFDFGSILEVVGYYYNTAQIAPEMSGVGIATTSFMNQMLNYPNLYRWRYRDQVNVKLTKAIGWSTSPRSKQYIVSFGLNVSIKRSEAEPLIHSSRLLEEVRTFVRKGPTQYGAASGCFDDMCLAWLISLTVSNDEDFTKFVAEQEDQEANVADKFFEPGKGKLILPADADFKHPELLDSAYRDIDVETWNPVQTTEVDGW